MIDATHLKAHRTTTNGNGPTMLLHDGVYNGETQARALVSGGEEGLQSVLAFFSAHAPAAVFHLETYARMPGQTAQNNFSAVFRHGENTVHDQIDESLLQGVPIRENSTSTYVILQNTISLACIGCLLLVLAAMLTEMMFTGRG